MIISLSAESVEIGELVIFIQGKNDASKHLAICSFAGMSLTSATGPVSAVRPLKVQKRTTPFEPVINCEGIEYQIKNFEPIFVRGVLSIIKLWLTVANRSSMETKLPSLLR